MRWKKNRMKRLARHIAKFPNDMKAVHARESLKEDTTPRGPCRSQGAVCKQDPFSLHIAHIERPTFRMQLQAFKKQWIPR